MILLPTVSKAIFGRMRGHEFQVISSVQKAEASLKGIQLWCLHLHWLTIFLSWKISLCSLFSPLTSLFLPSLHRL